MPELNKTEIAIAPPAVEGRIEITSVGWSIGSILAGPTRGNFEFGLHDLTHAVGEIKRIDEAGGLPAHRPAVGIVLRANEFDIGGIGAEVIIKLLP